MIDYTDFLTGKMPERQRNNLKILEKMLNIVRTEEQLKRTKERFYSVWCKREEKNEEFETVGCKMIKRRREELKKMKNEDVLIVEAVKSGYIVGICNVEERNTVERKKMMTYRKYPSFYDLYVFLPGMIKEVGVKKVIAIGTYQDKIHQLAAEVIVFKNRAEFEMCAMK